MGKKMKKNTILGLVLFCLGIQGAFASDLAGMPMKHKMASQMQCSVCHGTQTNFTKPKSDSCIACHGPMGKIQTKKNTKDKYPHQSAHYGDTVECSVCHAEHKPSKDLCSNCHKVEWQNFR